MAEDLWQLRKRKGMSVKQLAGKTGIPFDKLIAYERGDLIPSAHMARLARALFVDVSAIKAQSDPKPDERKPVPKADAHKPSAKLGEAKPAAPPKVKVAFVKPARASQITHLLQLAAKLGEDETAVAAKVGKPLSELTLPEASQWLQDYMQAVAQATEYADDLRPPGTRRKRACLPEGVDEFELNYLTARQEAGEMLRFQLLNGEAFNGRIVGFSPYAITIQQADGREVTLQKLALAYYGVLVEEAAA